MPLLPRDPGTTWTCVVCGATTAVGHRWAAIREWKRGWYWLRSADLSFCPAHCPPFAKNYPVHAAGDTRPITPSKEGT